MRILYDISDGEVLRARTFFDTWRSHSLVTVRQQRNVDGVRDPIDRDQFWEALVSALLTTRQRSGPASAVSRFISEAPFPLGLSACQASRPCADFVERRITIFGGIRRGHTIARELHHNLEWLERDGWASVIPWLLDLEGIATPATERSIARHLAASLKGLGPKQARNVLQMLGLSRYETPIDSRIAKWLNDFGFPVHLAATGLSDPSYYEFVADGFQALCDRAGVLPCLMDAAIFVSFDGPESGERRVIRW